MSSLEDLCTQKCHVDGCSATCSATMTVTPRRSGHGVEVTAVPRGWSTVRGAVFCGPHTAEEEAIMSELLNTLEEVAF